MDSFLAYAGCNTIMKITVVACPRELEDTTFRKVYIPSNKKEFEAKEEVGNCREDEILIKNTRTELNHQAVYSQVEAGIKILWHQKTKEMTDSVIYRNLFWLIIHSKLTLSKNE